MTEASEDEYAEDYDDEYSIESNHEEISNEEQEDDEGNHNHAEDSNHNHDDNKDEVHKIESIARPLNYSPEVCRNDVNLNDTENDTHSDETVKAPLAEASSSHSIPKSSDTESRIHHDDETEEALRQKLWESSKILVREGEKNITLAQDVDALKNELEVVKKEANQIRQALLQGINEGSSDAKNFSNIPLCELLRIRLQEGQQDKMENSMRSSAIFRRISRIDIDNHSQSGLHSSEKSMKHESEMSNHQSDVAKLRQKITEMAERNRRERDNRAKLEKAIESGDGKVETLSDHIEKLMVHLKHEALSKARALADRTRSIKEVALLKKRTQILEKRNTRKDKVITDLKAGSKILEDQLRLMDDKYMDLRIKLDWTRTQTERILKKKDVQVRDLRAKFVLATDLMAEKAKKQPGVVLLDDFDVSKKQNIPEKKAKSKIVNKLPSTELGIT